MGKLFGHALALNGIAHGADQQLTVHLPLDQKILCASVHGLHGDRGVVQAAQDDDRNVRRARVQLAELYLATKRPELARVELQEVLADAPHAPAFQRKRERVWVRRARGLLRKIR